MSRVGKRPIPIPDGVSVDMAEGVVRVKGPKGTLSEALPEVICERNPPCDNAHAPPQGSAAHAAHAPAE